MSEVLENCEKKTSGLSLFEFGRMFFCFILADMVSNAGWLPHALALMLAFIFAFTIDYWRHPRPSISFVRWSGKLMLLSVYLLCGLWVAPLILRKWLWPPIASGVPIFLLFLSMHWIPTLKGPKPKESMKEVLVVSSAFAFIIAFTETSVWQNWIGRK